MPAILLDMDGVLTDFAAAAAALFDAEPPGPGHLHQPLHQVLGIPPGVMWSRIDDAGPRFWMHLAPTPWADDLVALARSTGTCWIASSPSASADSVAGKLRWLQKRFGKRFRDFVITPHKHLLAAPDRILIDDSPKHIDAFIAAGGRAVLFPTWENGTRQEGVDPLDAIRAAIV